MTGNGLNFLIQLIFTPIISRVFPSEAYGSYALYNIIISNIVFFGSLSLPSVFILSKNRIELYSLGKIVLLLNIAISLLLALGYFTFQEVSVNELKLDNSAIILILLVILTKNLNFLDSFNLIQKKFNVSTRAKVIGSLISKISSLTLSLLIMPSGSIFLLSDFLKNVFLFFTQNSLKRILVFFRFLLKSNYERLLSALNQNINVIKYIYPSGWITKLSNDLPILIYGVFYSVSELGEYSFVVGILSIPINLISNSINPVFLQRINDEFRSGKNIKRVVFKLTSVSFLILILPFIGIAILSPSVFEIIFGSEWKIAGNIASILSLQYFFIAVSQVTVGTRRVLRLEKNIFYISLLMNVFKIIPFSILCFTSLPLLQMVIIQSCFVTLGIAINYLNLIWRLTKRLDETLKFGFLIATLTIVLIISSIYSI